MCKVLCIILLSISLNAKIYEDMYSSKVSLEKVEKIYASSPILLYSLYAIDKSKIAGLVFPFNEAEAKYLQKDLTKLPVIGGWFGKGNIPNSEMILKVNPDLILLSDLQRVQDEKKLKESLGNINIPFFYLKSTSLEDIVESFLYLGELSKKEQRAKKLYEYGKDTLNFAKEVSKQFSNKKPRVYYAQGFNGLQTECNTSLHAELINLANATNVHQCQAKSNFGKQSVNFEQVLTYNPEIILVYEKEFYKKIYKEAQWQFIDAVKNKRVYFLPKGPFSWFDRPPSFMKLLGLKYLLNIFYPSLNIDIRQEAKDFYNLFLEYDLSDEELDEIMGKNLE